MTPQALIEQADRLREYATEIQIEYLDALIAGGSFRAAADRLGRHHSTVTNGLQRLANAAALRGFSPEHDMTRTVPDPFIVRGVSTYYNKEGQPAGQWVKSRVDDDKRFEMLREAVDALREDLPRAEAVKAPAMGNEMLCNQYILTDCHLGMLAWEKEGGANWDMQTAERVIAGCFDLMVANSPPAEHAIVAQLGDWMHFDGLTPETPSSRHVLDADSRFSKLVRVALRLLCGCLGALWRPL